MLPLVTLITFRRIIITMAMLNIVEVWVMWYGKYLN